LATTADRHSKSGFTVAGATHSPCTDGNVIRGTLPAAPVQRIVVPPQIVTHAASNLSLAGTRKRGEHLLRSCFAITRASRAPRRATSLALVCFSFQSAKRDNA